MFFFNIISYKTFDYLFMPEKNKLTELDSSIETLDLDALNGLSFGPSWADNNSSNIKKRKSLKQSSYRDRETNKSNKNFKKDRRGKSKFRQNDFTSRNSNTDGNNYAKKISPLKKFDIKIYPQDDTFDALIKQLKIDCKTYQLFELTQIILEKPERFVLLINRLKDEHAPEPIYFCPRDKMPFDTKEEAIDHFFDNFISDFYEITDIEVDAPKGDFKLVYRCPFSQKLLSPPNYHLFQDILKSHYKDNVKGMSLADYQNKLICENDPDAVNEWSSEMKKAQNFKLITQELNLDNDIIPENDLGKKHDMKLADDSKIEFNLKDQALNYLLNNYEEQIVRKSDNFRLNGALLSALPKGSIKESILSEIQTQKRFPLDSANNIRGRLRRHKFTIYKKGSKGVSYVCSVKRKFRDSKTVFTESICELIKFIESNQGINIHNLPYKYLGIEKFSESNKTNTKPSQSLEENSESLTKKPDSLPIEKFDISESNKEKFKEIIQSLRWLISEGYVTEYSDSSIFINPILEAPNPKNTLSSVIKKEEIDNSKNMRKTKEAAEKESSNREVNKNSIDASEDSTAL